MCIYVNARRCSHDLEDRSVGVPLIETIKYRLKQIRIDYNIQTRPFVGEDCVIA